MTILSLSFESFFDIYLVTELVGVDDVVVTVVVVFVAVVDPPEAPPVLSECNLYLWSQLHLRFLPQLYLQCLSLIIDFTGIISFGLVELLNETVLTQNHRHLIH